MKPAVRQNVDLPLSSTACQEFRFFTICLSGSFNFISPVLSKHKAPCVINGESDSIDSLIKSLSPWYSWESRKHIRIFNRLWLNFMKRDFFNAKTVTIITSCCHVATFCLFLCLCFYLWGCGFRYQTMFRCDVTYTAHWVSIIRLPALDECTNKTRYNGLRFNRLTRCHNRVLQKQKQRQTDRQTETEIETQRQRETVRETQRETHTQRLRQRRRERMRLIEWLIDWLIDWVIELFSQWWRY